MITEAHQQRCSEFYQLPKTALPRSDCSANEPNSLWLAEGEKDGMIPNGNPFANKDNCWILRALLALAPSIGAESPGTALETPSRTWGVEMFRFQNAASITVLSFAIFLEIFRPADPSILIRGFGRIPYLGTESVKWGFWMTSKGGGTGFYLGFEFRLITIWTNYYCLFSFLSFFLSFCFFFFFVPF